MKTQYYTATSLDGFLATLDDSLDWLFPLGYLDNSSYSEFISEVGALAMGSATCEWIVRNSDKVAEETGTDGSRHDRIALDALLATPDVDASQLFVLSYGAGGRIVLELAK